MATNNSHQPNNMLTSFLFGLAKAIKQMPYRKPRYLILNTLALASLSTLNAEAQQFEAATTNRNFKIIPRVSLSETFSDNVSLSKVNRTSEFTTQLSPGIRVDSNGGRLKGFVDYSLTQVLYAKNSGSNELQNSLNASGIYELVDKWAFFDFGSTISQQSISAFGPQSFDNTSLNSNRTEVATYRLSPYVRGRLSSFADYQIRYRYEATKSKAASASDSETRESSVKLSGETFFSKLRWSTELTDQDIDYSLGRDTASERIDLILTYAINSQFDLIITGAQESNNYVSFDKKRHGSNGLGLNWLLSDRTRLSGKVERRYFGDTHTFNIEHRTPRTAWSYVDNKSLSTSSNPNNLTSLGGLYDLLYTQFSTVEPDPIKRADLVRSFLQVNGLNSNVTSAGSYATSNLSLQRNQLLTLTLIGIRDTVTLSASRNKGQILGGLASATDDFANVNAIVQNGLTVSYSHRLTPDASVNLLLSQQKSAGASSSLNTRLRTVNINLSTRFAEKIYGNLGARHTVSDGSSSPYKENSLAGSVNIQF